MIDAHARGCLVGLAVGDAVGATAEFRPKGSDDTSMALCLAESLVESRVRCERSNGAILQGVTEWALVGDEPLF